MLRTIGQALIMAFERLMKTSSAPLTETPAPSPFQELRTSLHDPDIVDLLPPEHQVHFVTHSRSDFFFDPYKWVRNAYKPDECEHRFSIEVVNRRGQVVAAVGWDSVPDFEYACTFGTYVSRRLRRRGIGKALWRAMIRHCGKPGVEGCAVTDEGYTLLTAMKEQFPGVVSFSGGGAYSFLEDLRKKKGRAA